MNIRQALKMAVKSICSNVVRSLLTMLGVIIGLAAVIILVSYSQGKNLATKALYESQGKNILEVYAYSWNADDVGDKLYDYCQGLDEVAGITPNAQVWNNMTITYGAKTLAQNNGDGMYFMGGGVYVESVGGGGGQQEDHYPSIYLGNDQFGLCNNYQIAKGREFSYLEIVSWARTLPNTSSPLKIPLTKPSTSTAVPSGWLASTRARPPRRSLERPTKTIPTTIRSGSRTPSNVRIS